MRILLTGCAGFIGFHLTKKLLEQNIHITGIDNLNDYYDSSLKNKRLKEIENFLEDPLAIGSFKFLRVSIEQESNLLESLQEKKFDVIINLAAQAGVRFSLNNPDEYINSNILGFHNIMKIAKDLQVKHFIFASSSSVYGMNKDNPFKEIHNTDHPVSLYAATKKANEVLAFSYSHLHSIPTTGLRFFTVYGPFGRPDMAYYEFTRKILAGETISLFNNGDMLRDFTYIDDVTESIARLIKKSPEKCSSHDSNAIAPFRILNIGNSNPVKLHKFIEEIESALNKKAIVRNLPMQPGDVPITFSDSQDLEDLIGYVPQTQISTGIRNFTKWFRSFHGDI